MRWKKRSAGWWYRQWLLLASRPMVDISDAEARVSLERAIADDRPRTVPMSMEKAIQITKDILATGKFSGEKWRGID